MSRLPFQMTMVVVGLAGAGCAGSEIAVAEPEPEGFTEIATEASGPELALWRRGVGTPVLRSASGPNVAVDAFAVVSWNANVGRGDLGRLVDELRSGALTGRAEPHFVLLLQEVVREGGSVPPDVPEGVRFASAISNDDGAPEALLDVAEREGLSVYYEPSMRNGRGHGVGEDRGSAILSTFELLDHRAIELPLERQRRVAPVAVVAGRTRNGGEWSFLVASVHLDPSSGLSRPIRSLGEGRGSQMEALLADLPEAQAGILGSDLNTWWGGADEPAVRVAVEAFPDGPPPSDRGTLHLPLGLPDPTVDYLFFDLPEGWEAQYDVVDNRYGSDHRPLVGRVWYEAPTQVEFGR